MSRIGSSQASKQDRDHGVGQGQSGDEGLEQHEGDGGLDGPLKEGVHPNGKSAVLVSYLSTLLQVNIALFMKRYLVEMMRPRSSFLLLGCWSRKTSQGLLLDEFWTFPVQAAAAN